MQGKVKKLPIYNGKLGIFVLEDSEELKNVFSPKSVDNSNFSGELYACAATLEYRGKNCYTVVLNFNSYHGKITHGTIAHEAHHIKNMILSGRGVVPDFDNDEAEAYLLNYIVDFIYKNLKQWKLVKKIK